MNNSKKAFTLLETIIATACVGILLLLFERFLVVNLKAYYQNSMKLDLTDQSINAYHHLNPDLRGATQILTCQPNELTFYLKIGDLNIAPKKVSYTLNIPDRVLTRSVIEPTGTAPDYTYTDDPITTDIASSVSNSESKPLFSYYGSDGNQLTEPCNPSLITLIGVDLRNQGTSNYASGEIESKTRIQVRNLKAGS